MAYISTNEVKEVRKALKEKFGKNIKFSVTRDHYTGISVSIMEGVMDFYGDKDMGHTDRYNNDKFYPFTGHAQINHYHTHMYGKYESLFDDIKEICHTAPAKAEGGRAYYDNSDAMIDYFDTAFYVNINVGKWDKPYIKKAA
jgi:hypothetical protein